MVLKLKLLLSAAVCLAFCSCNGDGRVQTFPVTGQILLDGKPIEGIRIDAVPITPGVVKEKLLMPKGGTNAEGKFELFTYVANDGIPDGEYKLTFKWFERQGKLFSDKDKFGGKYADPAQSTVTFKVDGTSVDLGTIELSSQ
jgi:5-hydroxyisourate hydrolase-like protein (transthyretin family)